MFNFDKKDNINIILALCLLILGVVLVFQYKTAKTQVNPNSVSYISEFEEYKKRLNEEIELGKTLEQENRRLNLEYNNFIDEYADDVQNFDLSNKIELVKKYRIMAGLTDVEGDGIIVTLRDAQKNDALNPSLFIIHDMDILMILNEVKAAGAKAISINGERILPVSEIMCAGPTVRINKNRYPVPYVIDVIGDANVITTTLENSLIYELLKDYDISIKIEKKSAIIIKKYYESIEWTINLLTEVPE